MESREYDLNSYRLHILKSDKAKSVHLEIHFRDNVDKNNIYYKTMLTDILTDCSVDYMTRKDVVVKLEELYKASFYGTTSKLGGMVDNIFVYNFINPEFINDQSYFEEVFSLPFDMILKPKAKNKAFDKTVFDVVKNRAIKDIESVMENPVKLSISNALKAFDENSVSSISVSGKLNDVKKVTSEDLYCEYKNMLKNSYCDIYVIGDVDFDEVYKIITKKFNLNTIKTGKIDLNVTNKLGKVKKVNEKGSFVQTNLNVVCNLDNLTDEEKNITLQVYNYILGSGGLSSKLYQKLREQHSLCYGVYSIFLKYDNLLIVQVSIDDKNQKKAILLIKQALNEMVKGLIKEEEFSDAKVNLLSSLKMAKDSNITLLSNYIFNKLDNLPSIDERMDYIKNVTIDDVKTVAKKVKINTIYTLKGGSDERDKD